MGVLHNGIFRHLGVAAPNNCFGPELVLTERNAGQGTSCQTDFRRQLLLSL